MPPADGERALPKAPAPKPKDAEDPAAKFDEEEYGNASSNFLDDLRMASVAVAKVGRGIKERTVSFRDGWDVMSDVSNGSNISGGRLAMGWGVNKTELRLQEAKGIPNSTPTSTSLPSDLPSLRGFESLDETRAAGVVRARFGIVRFGRSGVGLRSMASSCLPSSSSFSCRLFMTRTVDGEPALTAGIFQGTRGACEEDAAQAGLDGGAERPKPKPRGDGAWFTGRLRKPTCSAWWLITSAMLEDG